MIAHAPKRRRSEVIGVIDPERLYSTRAVLRYAGIGREKLAEARQRGLKMYRCGSDQWYRGRDLIALIVGE